MKLHSSGEARCRARGSRVKRRRPDPIIRTPLFGVATPREVRLAESDLHARITLRIRAADWPMREITRGDGISRGFRFPYSRRRAIGRSVSPFRACASGGKLLRESLAGEA